MAKRYTAKFRRETAERLLAVEGLTRGGRSCPPRVHRRGTRPYGLMPFNISVS
jgi:hypothetical protein